MVLKMSCMMLIINTFDLAKAGSFFFEMEKWLLFTAGNERARKKHDVRISLLILHRVVSFLQL